MGEEAEQGWSIRLTIDSVFHSKKTVVVTLELAEKFSLDDKCEHYKKRRVTHY